MKTVKQMLLRTMEIVDSYRDCCMASGERDWAQLQMQHGQVGTDSQGAGWGSGDGKLLKETSGVSGDLNTLTQQDSC